MTRPYVVTISSEKGGVGKTTLATNLAIYLKARDAKLPVTLLSFDNHFSVDRMFGPNRTADHCDVRGLFDGIPLEQLIVEGDYGVRFVPSSSDLPSKRTEAEAIDRLTQTLLASNLDGVLIIDTRPDLDVFTRNALYASDRVIVPVKDAPSLENCRHLFEYFDRENLSRSALKLLPSLIDARIRYEGPFKDPYQLLKGYAINRGYSCYDLYIAKSPKVESLGTNPTGRIFPILTHGRQTEVHQQMCQLTMQVYDDLQACQSRRLQRAYACFATNEALEEEAFKERLRTIDSRCLLCGKSLEEQDAQHLFYGETLEGMRGMAEESCLTRLLFQHFNSPSRMDVHNQQLLQLFRESAGRSLFVLHRQQAETAQLDLMRFDLNGRKASHASADCQNKRGRLLGGSPIDFSFLLETTLRPRSMSQPTLVLRQADHTNPATALHSDHYQTFQQLLSKIASELQVVTTASA